MTPGTSEQAHTLIVLKDGSSNNQGSGVSLILENETRLNIKVSIHFKLLTTNNQVEYEVFIVDLTLATKMEAQNIKLQTDSWLVLSQVKRDAQNKDPLLQRCVTLTRENLEKFKSNKILHVPMEDNTKACFFYKLSSIIAFKVKHPFIQETLRRSRIESLKVMIEIIEGMSPPSWISPIVIYIKQGTFPTDLT